LSVLRTLILLAIVSVPAWCDPLQPLELSGSPTDIGRQHGTLLTKQIRLVVNEYIKDSSTWRWRKEEMLERVRRMKPSLPSWFREELTACAEAAGVDEDILLYAQCEGDIRSLHGCTTYVAFGDATRGDIFEIGRSFDYWGFDSTESGAVILAVKPVPADGYAFVSVGWAGILGGWTFINEKGVFVGNNIGGGYEKNPEGIPTLIMERIIAQKAGNLEEAVKLVHEHPRMRGQVLVIGYTGDEAAGIPSDAVVIEYDAKNVKVIPHTGGFAFDSSAGRDPIDIRKKIRRRWRDPTGPVCYAGTSITLHSVAIRPLENAIWVAHGDTPSAHLGGYTRFDLRKLLSRER
jgi:hypothetical protein